jgi:predicted phage replisome organizer
MADNEKYYYLRLKEDFFEDDAIQILEAMPDGYLYSNILLKLYLKSLKFSGKLMFNERIPYNPTVLATITRHNVGTIEKALQIFKELGLIEILDNGAMYMLDIQNFIGKTSTEADRKRAYRERIEKEKVLIGQKSGQISDKSTPEIEIEKEIDIEVDINNVQKKHTEKVSKKEIDDFFEKIWKLYPLKRGKGQVSDTQKKKLYNVGFEQLSIAVERYKDELKKDDWRKQQNGSTFFNSGYVDYLDGNYQPSDNIEKSKGTNKFSQFPQREYSSEDYKSIEQKLLNKALGGKL